MPLSLRPHWMAIVLLATACCVGPVAMAQSRSVGAATSGASRAYGNLNTSTGAAGALPSAAGLSSASRFPAGLPSPIQGNLPSPSPFPGDVPSSVIVPPGAAGAVDNTIAAPTPNSGLAPQPGVGVGAGTVAAQPAQPNTAFMGASAAGGPAGGPAGPPYNPVDVSASFTAADTDADGELSRAEAERLRLRPGPFEQMDRDGNGRITRFEFQDATGQR